MDNFTKFPNDIYDQLLSYEFTRSQLLIVLYVIRKTDGWNKPGGDYISMSRIAKDTGMTRCWVSKTIRSLMDMGVLEVYEGNTPTSLKLMRVAAPESWEKHV